ncbi:IclR family transcriptional regulator C-terminal domain-containing protein [Streptomyces sp. NPDC059752]|uniref:IclR family transcriptional regulator domain-containing protein n=1 Tax=unclassified Streptomyces TaxID=2593676 RepID=UPI003656EA89
MFRPAPRRRRQAEPYGARHHIQRLTFHTITSERALFHQLDHMSDTELALDLREYALGTVCATVPTPLGSAPECVALSLRVGQAHHLPQASRTLRRPALAVMLSQR